MTDISVKTDTITLPLLTAIRGLNAVLPHTSKDPQTPLLGTVLLTAEYMYATDRYTLARFRHGAENTGAADIILPREAAVWLTRLTAYDLDTDKSSFKYMNVTFTSDTISVYFDGASDDPREGHSFTAPDTNFGFPPVWKLLDRWEPATELVAPTFNGDDLAAFTTSAKKLTTGKRREDLTVKLDLGKPGELSKYPGPVRVTIADDFVGLIQPLRTLA